MMRNRARPRTDGRRARVLFISYTGLLEPLGMSQVLPYVRGLARRGHRMSLLSFERGSASGADRFEFARRLREDGIPWRPAVYHKRPAVLSTLRDIASGVSIALAARHDVKMIHARSHVAAFIAEIVRRLTGIPYVFDHRGLMAEEYADSGIWRRGSLLYRATTACEALFLRNAGGVVVLTQALAKVLASAASRLAVIPCAVDLDSFRPASPDAARPYDLVYAGSWSGLYLQEETLRFWQAYRRRCPERQMLIVTPEVKRSHPALDSGVEFRAAQPDEVPALLRLARAALSLRKPGRAQIAASPVKVSEYLASGLPVVSTAGVGDLDALLERHRAGVTIGGFAEADLEQAVTSLERLLRDGEVGNRCRRLAEERYSLSAAIERYHGVYEQVLCQDE